jgi:hypothetical protein
MAIHASQRFDYEITPLPARPGESPYRPSTTGWRCTTVNLQSSRGELPGLAGLRPTVRVEGDRLRVDSDPAERPPAAWTEWLTLVVPPLHDRWLDRCHRRAQVRAFEFDIPGLGARLREGLVLRVRFEINGVIEAWLCEGADERWRCTLGATPGVVCHAW